MLLKRTEAPYQLAALPRAGSIERGWPQARLEKPPCFDTPPEYQLGYREAENIVDEFYAARVVDPSFEHPPESFTIRKILRNMFEGTGRYPNAIWTWNPRYYASTLKTKITYEAYPDSQAEVDALVSKLPHRVRVFYDP